MDTVSDKSYEAIAQLEVNLTVTPAIPTFEESVEVRRDTSLQISPISLRLGVAFRNLMDSLLSDKISTFFDQERALKTVLNFGDDYQALLTNWQYDSRDPLQATILAKLYRPLPTDIDLGDTLWISRELSPPITDRIVADYPFVEPPKVYLRPANKDIKITGRTGTTSDNKTLRTLLSSGSYDPIKLTDPVLEEWYTFDVNQTEINVNYADYRQFISFGSATGRLTAFVNKLRTLENLTSIITLNSSSLALTGSMTVTSSLPYLSVTKLADEKLDILRSFDPYERFLYYESNVPYSSSLTTSDHQDVVYYNSDATWPKVSGSVVSVASASAWLSNQYAIAQEYDIVNSNSLVNTLPEYIRNDEESNEFLTFLHMIGHQFDTLKVYIDHMSSIYDRSSDPDKGLSADLVWNLANSLGVELPNQYAITNLVDYTIGERNQVSPMVYRRVAAETWKRFLHNQIFMMKTKGTKASLRALANTYGILPNTLQIRESATPGVDNLVPSYEIYEEQTAALRFMSPSYITIPWATSSLANITTQVRFASTTPTQSVILNGSNWALGLQPLSGSYGRVVLKNQINTIVASSSLFEVYGGEFFSVMLRRNSSNISFYVKRAEGEDIIDSFESNVPTGSLNVSSSAFVHLGGSGSFFGTPFIGHVDEFRVWGEQITNDTFEQQVRYPGLYNGNTTTSTRDSLWVRLSFGKPQNLGISSSIANESPWARSSAVSASMKAFTAFNFPNQPQYPNSMEIITREVLRYTPNAGTSQFSTNKVIVAPPAIPNTFGESGIPVLSPTNSTVSLVDKKDRGESTNTVGFYFSISDAINDSIIRSIGTIDLQDLLGDPSDQFEDQYKLLSALNNLYWTSYAYDYNVNSFVDFVKNLLGPLFSQARQLIPVRTKLLSGIVHEPHILERNKIKHRPLQVSAGTLTRNSNDTQNLEASPIKHQDTTTFTSVSDDVSFILDLDASVYDVTSTTDNIEAVVSTQTMFPVNASFALYDEQNNVLSYIDELLRRYQVSSYLELSSTQREEYSRLLAAYKSPNVIDLRETEERAKSYANIVFPDQDFFPIIVNPLSDFTDIGSYTYFTHPEGLWSIDGVVNIRAKQNILRDRQTWEFGATYSQNDYVLQNGMTGDATLGNELEFVCITTDAQFVSYVAPYLDKDNWKQMSYIPTPTRILKEVIIYNGELSVAPSGSSYPNPRGYLPYHYRNTRDMRRGTLNSRWYGCVQTSDTTPDGGDPVVITFTAGDRLVVANPGEPVQPKANQIGPILDII